MFITFEGGEGTGKTTQIAMLKSYLENQGKAVITTREPGGTPKAEKLRKLHVEIDGEDWLPKSEVLILYTARLEHVEKLIKPALLEGKIVVSDRFSDSTIAYQGYGRQVDMGFIRHVDDLVIDGFKPDLTFIFDLDVNIGLERSLARLKDQQSKEDKFEKLDIGFHERMRQGYLDIAQSDPKRCVVINANQSVDAIHGDVINAINARL
jgi:dTMP kinase